MAKTAKAIGKGTGRDPVVMAAVGSVVLAWFQFYVRGNKQNGLFVGLWAPTLLAFSNAVHVRSISQTLEGDTQNLVEWLKGQR